MMNRRTVLASLSAGVAAIPALALGHLERMLLTSAQSMPSSACDRTRRGPYADYLPNVVVHTHENQKALFYDDLLLGKTVILNCMSVKNDAVYPVTENLARVQKLLGDRVGRDVFMYSITVDPAHDTPRVLSAFAKKHGVGPGWLFLTGKPEDIELLRGRLFAHGGGHVRGSGPVQDCSLGLIRYGNEAVGPWGSVPAKTSPEWIVKRLSWVTPRPKPTGSPQRRGPAVMAWTEAQS